MTITARESELLEIRDTDFTADQKALVESICNGAERDIAMWFGKWAPTDDRFARFEAAVIQLVLDSTQ